ncbi:hypothetical protein LSH36_207g04008 [Paralvinella palmiformis]|uniref:Uncharacterized protein n=1 Tax=Paralvinella palmiformis TaxID=53620 RepID=A0AAD9JNV6_9ANNE|nr:hypothetical protein LSH36_207g04008 [Paralvinella palmiformis]
MLRHTDGWANIYISIDLTPTERDIERKLRQKLRVIRDAGERNLIIRSSHIVTRATEITINQREAENSSTKGEKQRIKTVTLDNSITQVKWHRTYQDHLHER